MAITYRKILSGSSVSRIFGRRFTPLNPNTPEGDCGIRFVFLFSVAILGHKPYYVLVKTSRINGYNLFTRRSSLRRKLVTRSDAGRYTGRLRSETLE
jgi:hypothetical protein